MLKKDYKAELNKTESGKYVIKVSDFYKESCNNDEFVEVSEEVLDYLIEQRRLEKKCAMRDYRHLAAFELKEVEIGELCGIVSESVEETVMRNYEVKKLYKAIETLDNDSRKRFFLYYEYCHTLKEIAKTERVDRTTVGRRLERTLATLRKILSENHE